MPCIQAIAIVVYPVVPVRAVIVGDGLGEGRPGDSQQQDGEVFIHSAALVVFSGAFASLVLCLTC